ncbi:hypothetical protein N9J45_00930 [Gammaproteobacteria bacterium]|nr:hypothetical protein [Gammaproteobacteria bacterium]
MSKSSIFSITPRKVRNKSTTTASNARLIFFAVIASVIGTTLGKIILDKIDDRAFFVWTQSILLTIGAVFIAYALYLMK